MVRHLAVRVRPLTETESAEHEPRKLSARAGLAATRRRAVEMLSFMLAKFALFLESVAAFCV